MAVQIYGPAMVEKVLEAVRRYEAFRLDAEAPCASVEAEAADIQAQLEAKRQATLAAQAADAKAAAQRVAEAAAAAEQAARARAAQVSASVCYDASTSVIYK